MLELFQTVTFINGITILIFGIFILIKNRNQKSVRAFFLFSVFFAVWMIAFSFQVIEKNYNNSLILTKIFMLGANFIPVAFLYFICIIIDVCNKKIIKYIVSLFWIWAIILSLFLLTPFYIDYLKPKLIFHWWLVPGLFFHFQFITTEIIFLICIFLVIKNHKKIGQQSKDLLLGAGVAIISGSSNYYLCYDIFIMPYLNFLMPVQLMVYVYCIMKYNIMDVRKYLLKGVFSYLIFSIIFSIPIFVIHFIYIPFDLFQIILIMICIFLALIYKNSFIIGELENKVDIRTEELQSANEELETINTELVTTRDKLWSEMQIAKKIQTVLLPKNPKIKGYEISAYMKPADDVGGDYYDVINVTNGSWLIIGDVSGHGVPAGLVMMMVQTCIHNTLNIFPDISPSKLLKIINKTITENIQLMGEDKYMTMTVFNINKNDKFIFAGLHQNILIYRKKTNVIESIQTDGMWLGLMKNIQNMLKNDCFKLDEGDILLLYTDGITEAWKKESNYEKREIEKDMFGEKKLKQIFFNSEKTTPVLIQNNIIKELKKYTCKDDVTMLIIKKEENL